jgi:hypothetical protein
MKIEHWLTGLLIVLTIAWMATMLYFVNQPITEHIVYNNQTIIEQVKNDCAPMNNTVYVDRMIDRYIQSEGDWQTQVRLYAASHTYDRHNKNCVDFSRDVTAMLREQGYDAWQIQGHCTGDNYPNAGQDNHAWVEVRLWIEPQTGNIISPNECIKNM